MNLHSYFWRCHVNQTDIGLGIQSIWYSTSDIFLYSPYNRLGWWEWVVYWCIKYHIFEKTFCVRSQLWPGHIYHWFHDPVIVLTFGVIDVTVHIITLHNHICTYSTFLLLEYFTTVMIWTVTSMTARNTPSYIFVSINQNYFATPLISIYHPVYFQFYNLMIIIL